MSNHSFTSPDTCSTLITVARQRAQQQPDQRGYTFLLDGEAAETHMTYAELDRRARAIGAMLQGLGAAGERALLLYPPGLDYVAAFFGCLYAGVVAVPAYPPNPARLNRTLGRLQAIVEDARPLVALTTAPLLAIGEALLAQVPDFPAMNWRATDTLPPDLAAEWRPPTADGDTLAFLQYTSGSTGLPKGVMLTHGNLLHNSAQIHHAYGHSAESRGVIWLPPYHDMGLIGGILQPLYGAFPVVLMSPVDFLQRPLRWLQAISKYRATTSGGPNFAYDLCARKITPEQRAKLDLSSWNLAFNGAEPVRPDTIERFVETFGPCGFRREAFYPCYGLAEATLIVTGGAKAGAPIVGTFQRAALQSNRADESPTEDTGSQELVGAGRALLDQHLVIAKPETMTLCRPGQVGEIWVAGPSVAQGYWMRPEETARTFQARLAGGEAGPFLRTGDLGFLQEGELFVTGRLKDLIIIRGRNHYPQDIELTVERSHPALRPGCGAAFSVEAGGEERLVVVQEVDRQQRDLNVDELVGSIRRAVAEQHEIHVYAVALLKHGSIPKTSSGKIQRHACRDRFLADDLELVGRSVLEDQPADVSAKRLSRKELLALAEGERQARLEAYLRAQLALALNIAPARLEPHLPASSLGLDSLMAVELQYALENDLGIVIPMASFLEDHSIAQLAAQARAALAEPAPSKALATAQEAAGSYPLSIGQQAIWFLHQLAPESTAYNIASAVRVRGDLDVPALQRAFQGLVDRHPALRTTFDTAHGSPLQQVHAAAEVWFHTEDAAGWTDTALRDCLVAEAHRPFDLRNGPLLRVSLFERSEQEHVLLLVVHHIVADMWSLAVLTHELGVHYSAEKAGRASTLAPLALGYADYVRRQEELLAGQGGEQLWGYWQRQLADVSPVLELPADRPRPPIQTYSGATHTFRLEAEHARQLKAIAQAAGTTLYTTLLAAFQVLLHRYTGQQQFLVGSPTAGRNRAGLADVVGYFVNPLVLRADLAGNPSFAELLGRVRAEVQAAFEHQEYPFALLVQRLQPERDHSRSPLFQTMFVLQKAHLHDEAGLTAFALGDDGARLRLGDLQLESVALDQSVAQFDLTLMMAELEDGLAGSLQYNTDLFDAATIARAAGHMRTLLESIAADPTRRVGELPLLRDAERDQLLATWNHTGADYHTDWCIHHFFERQVERTPGAVALIWEDQRITYAELNRRANQLAHFLRQLGVGPEVRAGVCMERSPDMVVGLLGILKAGGAYIPLDPAYPRERLAFMIEDAQSAAILTQKSIYSLHFATDESPVSDNTLREHKSNTTEPDTKWDTTVIVEVDTKWDTIAKLPDTNPDVGVVADNLGYVIYTSGSTGRPKGVAIAHRNAAVLLDWAQTVYTAEQLAGVLASTSICFDLSVFELFVPLSCGGTVILAEDALRLPTLPAAREVTLVNTVPSAITELLRGDGIPDSVGTVNLAGEPLPLRLVQQLYEHPTIRQVVNLYGPSEDTTYSTYGVMPSDSAVAPSIGRPVANTQMYILDAYGQPTPQGVPGELYIGGLGLARGYLGRPELTAERFVPNPFAEREEEGERGRGGDSTQSALFPPSSILHPPSSRLYRTGDLCRYRPDGTLDFLGRIDHQIKLRGFRIELGEIETRLSKHARVREAIVVVREDRPGDRRLVAYVVPTTDYRPPTTDHDDKVTRRQGDKVIVDAEGSKFTPSPLHPFTPSPQELRAFLKQTLPEYMVPAAFVWLAALPLTPNGKVNRRALPAPDQSRPELEHAYVAPRVPVEERLAEIWAEVLGLDRVGIYDDFFTLGGHSLQATRLIGRVSEVFQVNVPLRSFFAAPRVADLATVVAQLQGEQVEQVELAQLLNELDELSEDEVKSLLSA